MATIQQVKAFINLIGPMIQAECRKREYSFPSAIIAQACIESAYGTSSLGYKYHNYFGMKCGSSWKGKSVNLKTKEEYTVGVLTTIKDNFRVFSTDEEGVAGYFDFISTPRYSNLKNATCPKNYLELLKQDGYATSSTYVNTVNSVIVTYNLTSFDDVKTSPVLSTKPVDIDVVRKVICGEYGNGAARQMNVTAAGYNYEEVRKMVNKVYTFAETIKPMKKELGDYWNLIDLV